MVYAKAFFDLQLQFAHKVTALSELPLTRVLLEYTNLYVRFGLGRDFNPAHPTWEAYLAGLQDTNDQREWTYRFYLTRAEAMAGPPVMATFGCFSYALLRGDRIRLHFQNADTEGRSSLGVACLGQRRADLTALFGHVKRTLHEGVYVVGVSWLYNLEAYRSLFPVSYVGTARVLGDRFQSMPLWGQFLDRHGGIREHMTRPFIERLERQVSVERLHEASLFRCSQSRLRWGSSMISTASRLVATQPRRAADCLQLAASAPASLRLPAAAAARCSASRGRTGRAQHNDQ